MARARAPPPTERMRCESALLAAPIERLPAPHSEVQPLPMSLDVRVARVCLGTRMHPRTAQPLAEQEGGPETPTGCQQLVMCLSVDERR
eukprot:6206134-Pleurochrysis_carterae.AAC.2